MVAQTAEHLRLEETRTQRANWRKWGPYLSERQWGTVREDYSPYGSAWDYFSHDQARSRAYRWGEDGIAGISDDNQYLCFAIALWNGNDPILKERMFGVTGAEGNHGEDVKDYYFYLDNTPSHSYMKLLYKYPQAAFPYTQLVEENRRRDRHDPEYELLDTGVFAADRYFDVLVEYAKAAPEDILIQVSITNRAAEAATLHLLPTLWFRNTWSWEMDGKKPFIRHLRTDSQSSLLEATHPVLGSRWLYCEGNASSPIAPELLFTENETNTEQLFGAPNASPYVKDAFHRYLVQGVEAAVNPAGIGTKAAAHYSVTVPAGATHTLRLRLSDAANLSNPFGAEFSTIWAQRLAEADDFYQQLSPANLNPDQRCIQRQAFAGYLWSKQFYYYNIDIWLKGDPTGPKPPKRERNRHWFHLDNQDILSMPDKWEYPYYCVWDTAFHALPLAMLDPEFAKGQLDIMTREWYMHPNGQIPAYEWAFGDVNAPVHAWATWRVYKIEQKMWGRSDRQFLERVFQKLLLNFTWWVNRKDREGRNVFEGGFLGMDNVGVFDRSAPLPTGGYIEQSDGTGWMGMYCLDLLRIALELAQENPVYEDIATKFFEHFIYIADAMNKIGEDATELWDDEDGFFYDVLQLPDGSQQRMKVRSMVGLVPLYAVITLEPDVLDKLPGFKQRVEWFLQNRPDLTNNVACLQTPGTGARRLLAICQEDKLRRILSKMLDETEFLSDYGLRSVSKIHQQYPYILEMAGMQYRVDYLPAESDSGLFGGNSNWRGPVWFPVNYLLIESLQRFHHYYGDRFQVECPTGSGQWMTLWQVARELSQRLIRLFLSDASGNRPVYGGNSTFQTNPHWRNHLLFYEYYHGDNGAGIGASHQTGWSGLVAKLIQQSAEG
jgi:hypothetical protein